MAMSVDPNKFIPLPPEWTVGEEHVAVAFLLGVMAGGRVGSLIVPPARVVLDTLSSTPVPDEVVDDIVMSMISSIGGTPGA